MVRYVGRPSPSTGCKRRRRKIIQRSSHETIAAGGGATLTKSFGLSALDLQWMVRRPCGRVAVWSLWPYGLVRRRADHTDWPCSAMAEGRGGGPLCKNNARVNPASRGMHHPYGFLVQRSATDGLVLTSRQAKEPGGEVHRKEIPNGVKWDQLDFWKGCLIGLITAAARSPTAASWSAL